MRSWGYRSRRPASGVRARSSVDDRLDDDEPALVDVRPFEPAERARLGEQLEHLTERPHPAQLAELVAEVLEGELLARDAAGQAFRLVVVQPLLGLSISERTSPMPIIREAMRSGWKSSRSSGFSPMPTKRSAPAPRCGWRARRRPASRRPSRSGWRR